MTKKSRRGVQKRALHDLPSLEGDPAPHHAEEKGGEGDNAQAADLKEDDRGHLSCECKILPDVDDGKPRHADRRSGREEGIDKGEPLRRGEGKIEEERAGQDHAGETEDEDPLRGRGPSR